MNIAGSESTAMSELYEWQFGNAKDFICLANSIQNQTINPFLKSIGIVNSVNNMSMSDSKVKC